jgi:hypothetical protein
MYIHIASGEIRRHTLQQSTEILQRQSEGERTHIAEEEGRSNSTVDTPLQSTDTLQGKGDGGRAHKLSKTRRNYGGLLKVQKVGHSTLDNTTHDTTHNTTNDDDIYDDICIHILYMYIHM